MAQEGSSMEWVGDGEMAMQGKANRSEDVSKSYVGTQCQTYDQRGQQNTDDMKEQVGVLQVKGLGRDGGRGYSIPGIGSMLIYKKGYMNKLCGNLLILKLISKEF